MSDSGAAAAPALATTTPAASKPAAEQTTTEKVVETVKRYIPGLAKQPDAASAPVKPAAKRSRSTKSKKAVVAGADDPALATATLAEAPEKSELPESLTVPSSNRPAPLSVNGGDHGAAAGMTDEELAALQHKRFSPVLSVQKKIRANNKKLQRVAAYEAETGQLNADQKKVVASKPALEAVQRELNELVKTFETEEADDEKRVAKKQQYQEKQTQLRINQALSNSKVSSQNDLTLLLQFLHLYSLFNPTHSHSTQVLPPVVANATNEQTAAVHTLFNNLANGPLFGASADGSSDAVSQIKSLQDGSDKTIIEGVSFADVKQMIFDLTAPPAEVGHEIPEEEAHSNGLSLNGQDSSSLQMPSVTDQPPLAGASAASAPALNFMQASELQEGETASYENDAPEHQRALESVSASATPGFGSGTPVVEQPEPTLQEAVPAAGWNADNTQLTADTLPSSGAAAWDDVNAAEPVQNWADEVDEHPSNPFTATAEVPAELEGQNKDAIDAVPVGGEAPGVAAAAGAGTDGRGRGRGRGGRGRGEGRGRGRGGFRGEGGNWRNQETNGGAPASAVQQALSAAGDGFTDVNRRGNRGGAGGEGRGGFRGGRGRGDGSRGDFRGGRGRGEGRGRGGPRSGPNTPTTQGAPAAAPSVGA